MPGTLLRRGGKFGITKELMDATMWYLVERNEKPQPYQRKAIGREILEKIDRA